MLLSGATQLKPAAGGSSRFGCYFVVQHLPKGVAEIRVETLGFHATRDVPVLHPGERSDDGTVSTSGVPANQIVIFQTIDRAEGDYMCRALSVRVDGADQPLTGETIIATSKAVGSPAVPEFVAAFPDAIRADDQAFLLKSLNPAVLDLYRQAQCENALKDYGDPSFAMSFLAITGPSVYTFNPDGQTIDAPRTFTLTVSVTSDMGSGRTDVHYPLAGDHLTFFTDCGDPLPV